MPPTVAKPATDGEEWVTILNPNDVLCGRGSGPNDHTGNVNFRTLVGERKAEYLSTNHRQTKARIAQDIVKTVKSLDPPGRFLRKATAEECRKLGLKGDAWCRVDSETALEKAKQALRQNREKGDTDPAASSARDKVHKPSTKADSAPTYKSDPNTYQSYPSALEPGQLPPPQNMRQNVAVLDSLRSAGYGAQPVHAASNSNIPTSSVSERHLTTADISGVGSFVDYRSQSVGSGHDWGTESYSNLAQQAQQVRALQEQQQQQILTQMRIANLSNLSDLSNYSALHAWGDQSVSTVQTPAVQTSSVQNQTVQPSVRVQNAAAQNPTVQSAGVQNQPDPGNFDMSPPVPQQATLPPAPGMHSQSRLQTEGYDLNSSNSQHAAMTSAVATELNVRDLTRKFSRLESASDHDEQSRLGESLMSIGTYDPTPMNKVGGESFSSMSDATFTFVRGLADGRQDSDRRLGRQESDRMLMKASSRRALYSREDSERSYVLMGLGDRQESDRRLMRQESERMLMGGLMRASSRRALVSREDSERSLVLMSLDSRQGSERRLGRQGSERRLGRQGSERRLARQGSDRMMGLMKTSSRRALYSRQDSDGYPGVGTSRRHLLFERSMSLTDISNDAILKQISSVGTAITEGQEEDGSGSTFAHYVSNAELPSDPRPISLMEEEPDNMSFLGNSSLSLMKGWGENPSWAEHSRGSITSDTGKNDKA